MVATANAYMASNSHVTISWRTRSLQDFADYPIEKLAETFDFILIDHPFVGFASACGCLLPVDQYVDGAFLADQAANSVGPSHDSYVYEEHLWALAVDAASQVSAYRPDLLEQLDLEPPRSWDAVLKLARARAAETTAKVAVPLIPVDALMCFCSLCANLGEEPFIDPSFVVSRPMGRYVLDVLRQLKEAAHPESTTWNPIRTFDRMSTTDEIAYVPMAFGYSNYARPGFRSKLIRFTNIPFAGDGLARGAILGGVGLAVSTHTSHPGKAFAYARYVASPDVQRGVFFQGGGQPGHRGAWLDPAVNGASSNFFLDTLETLDNAYLRPRYLGFMAVQDQAGIILHRFLTEGVEIEPTLDALDGLYRTSQRD
jgi:multiple sugar transport system substrate-binding protein